MIAEIILLEDQSQPLPSPFSLNEVTDTCITLVIFHAAGDDGEALRRHRGLSVTDVQHFTEVYKPGLSLKSPVVDELNVEVLCYLLRTH